MTIAVELLTLAIALLALGLSAFVFLSENQRADRNQARADRLASLDELRGSYARMTQLLAIDTRNPAARAELAALADHARYLNSELGGAPTQTDRNFLAGIYLAMNRPELAEAMTEGTGQSAAVDRYVDARRLRILAAARFQMNTVEKGRRAFMEALRATSGRRRLDRREQALTEFLWAASEAVAGRCPPARKHLSVGQRRNLQAGYNLKFTGEGDYVQYVGLCDIGGSRRENLPVD